MSCTIVWELQVAPCSHYCKSCKWLHVYICVRAASGSIFTFVWELQAAPCSHYCKSCKWFNVHICVRDASGSMFKVWELQGAGCSHLYESCKWLNFHSFVWELLVARPSWSTVLILSFTEVSTACAYDMQITNVNMYTQDYICTHN